MTEDQHSTETQEQLFDRLAAVAHRLAAAELLSAHQIATAFMAIGLEAARHAHGPCGAAEWLRDMADEVERPALAMN